MKTEETISIKDLIYHQNLVNSLEAISIKDLVYRVCEIYNVQQKVELQKLADEYESIKQELLKLKAEDKVKDHNMRNAIRISLTTDEIKLLVNKVECGEISINEFIERLILSFTYLTKFKE